MILTVISYNYLITRLPTNQSVVEIVLECCEIALLACLRTNQSVVEMPCLLVLGLIRMLWTLPCWLVLGQSRVLWRSPCLLVLGQDNSECCGDVILLLAYLRTNQSVVEIALFACLRANHSVVEIALLACRRTNQSVVDIALPACLRTNQSVVDIALLACLRTSQSVVDICKSECCGDVILLLASLRTNQSVVDIALLACLRINQSVVEIALLACLRTNQSVVEIALLPCIRTKQGCVEIVLILGQDKSECFGDCRSGDKGLHILIKTCIGTKMRAAMHLVRTPSLRLSVMATLAWFSVLIQAVAPIHLLSTSTSTSSIIAVTVSEYHRRSAGSCRRSSRPGPALNFNLCIMAVTRIPNVFFCRVTNHIIQFCEKCDLIRITGLIDAYEYITSTAVDRAAIG
eukprot:g66150.t1